jgi:hypothetical protein
MKNDLEVKGEWWLSERGEEGDRNPEILTRAWS